MLARPVAANATAQRLKKWQRKAMEEQKNINTKLLCYHCGEDLPKIKYQIDDKDFCCAGCMGVFKILSENNLCSYYTYNSNPGMQRGAEAI